MRLKFIRSLVAVSCLSLAVSPALYAKDPGDAAKQASKASKVFQEIMAAHADAYWNTTHDGIAFGAAVLGETLRDRRKMDVAEFAPEDHELLQALLFSTLAIYLAVNKLAKRYAINRIAHFGDYA